MLATVNQTDSFAWIFLIGSMIVCVLAAFWWIYAVFAAGFWWGAGCFFLPPVILVFVFAHWRKARGPLLAVVLSVGLAYAGMALASQSGGTSSDFVLSLQARTSWVTQQQWTRPFQEAGLQVQKWLRRLGRRRQESGGTFDRKKIIRVYHGSIHEALTKAVQADDVATARALLAQGADINRRSVTGLTPIMEAAALGYPDMVQMLLEYGADPYLRSPDGKTAADYAAENQRPAISDLLAAASQAPVGESFHASSHLKES